MLQDIHRLRTPRRTLMLVVLCTGLSSMACLNDLRIGKEQDGLALAYNGHAEKPHGGWTRGVALSSAGLLSVVALVGIGLYQFRRD